MKKVVLFFILILHLTYLKSQTIDIHIDNINTENGLSDNNVFCILLDSRGFVWIGTEDGLNRYDGYNFKVYKANQDDTTSLSNSYITAICEDKTGNLWIGTQGGGLNLFDYQTGKFVRFKHQLKTNNSLINNYITTIKESKNGFLWIGTQKGIDKLSFSKRKNHSYSAQFFHQKNTESISNVTDLEEDRNNSLWISTKKLGLINYQPQTTVLTTTQTKDYPLFFKKNPESIELLTDKKISSIEKQGFKLETKISDYTSENLTFTSFCEDKFGIYWIGTNNGLKRVNKKGQTLDSMNNVSKKIFKIDQNIYVSTIYIDKVGVIWCGTQGNGIIKIAQVKDKFSRHQFDNQNVRAIYQDYKKNIWVGTWGNGINELIYKNLNGYTLKAIKKNLYAQNSLSSDFISTIFKSKRNEVWIGNTGGWVNYFTINQNDSVPIIQNYKYTHKGNVSDLDCITSYAEDSYGNIWFGTTDEGLFRVVFENNTLHFVQFSHQANNTNSLCSNFITALSADDKGNLWIGTENSGLDKFNIKKNHFTHFVYETSSPNTLIDNHINTIHSDNSDMIWIGTNKGLSCYEPRKRTFTSFRKKDGLPDNIITCIVEDNKKNLWIGTYLGLSKFNLDAQTFNNYTIDGGLRNNTFSRNVSFRSNDGQIFLGNQNGFISFYPDSIHINPYTANVVITDFLLFNQSVPIGKDEKGRTLLSQNISETKEINLEYSDNIFSLEFSALNYFQQERNQFAYKLEGFQNDWIYTDAKKRVVTYSNLDAKRYVFKVKALNSDGNWCAEKVLIINVKSPWWKTFWAYLAYSLGLFGLLILARRYTINRVQLNESLKHEKQKRQEESDLVKNKLRFFTNVSHEFRTPLTLIIDPLEKLLNYKYEDDRITDLLLLMNSNAKRMLRLINELMDFNKTEDGKMELHATETNAINFLDNIYIAFSEFANQHNIHYDFIYPDKKVKLWLDNDKAEKIIYNLLSNAFKFTPESGTINLLLSVHNESTPHFREGYAKVIVEDSGLGIEKSDLKKIFQPFFQTENASISTLGTGIGLAIVKDFVALHKGTIEVESEKEKGSRFIVKFPLEKSHLSENEIYTSDLPYKSNLLIQTRSKNLQGAEKTLKSKNKLPIILVVEDNDEVRNYIKQILVENYSVIEANNGKDGFTKALEFLPDLIISDVMMPVMDGIQLCKQVKNEPETSHIPVILLTALTTTENRIEGLELGADEYITKPFNSKILELTVRNRIEARRKIIDRFNKGTSLDVKEITSNHSDERFLQSIISLIEENISDSDFNVESLSQKVDLDRSQVYRKIKTITGQTPSEFIRTIRLKYAAQLLKEKKLTIAEITYQVGFGTPSYFSKCFAKQFGKLPSEFIAEN